MSNIKLSLLIASVGLALASCVSLVDGNLQSLLSKSPLHTPVSLNNLGELEAQHWVKVLRDTNVADTLDDAFELLKQMDKIYEALGDDSNASGNEHKIREQFEVNQIDRDQFCVEGNLKKLDKLATAHSWKFQSHKHQDPVHVYHKSIETYLDKRKGNFAFLCKSYVLKDLDKKIGALSEVHKNNLLLLGERLSLGYADEWDGILLEFLSDISGKNWQPKCYVTGREGKEKFSSLWLNGTVQMCRSLREATSRARYFANCHLGKQKGFNDEQARWIQTAEMCNEIINGSDSFVESMYNELKNKYSVFRLKMTMNKSLKKSACSNDGDGSE